MAVPTSTTEPRNVPKQKYIRPAVPLKWEKKATSEPLVVLHGRQHHDAPYLDGKASQGVAGPVSVSVNKHVGSPPEEPIDALSSVHKQTEAEKNKKDDTIPSLDEKESPSPKAHKKNKSRKKGKKKATAQDKVVSNMPDQSKTGTNVY